MSQGKLGAEVMRSMALRTSLAVGSLRFLRVDDEGILNHVSSARCLIEDADQRLAPSQDRSISITLGSFQSSSRDHSPRSGR